jgi:serine/threonine-protein kinase HipA
MTSFLPRPTSEKQISLNLRGNKDWYAMNVEFFEGWTKSVGVPWRAVKPHLEDVMEKARSLWPKYLADSPRNDEQRILLGEHWGRLHSDFRIYTRAV